MRRPVLAVAIVAALALAGCVKVPDNPIAGSAPGGLEALAFAPAVRVDDARIASEPSVKVAKDGTIFVAGPTGTIKYATRPQDAVQHADKGIFQGAIWRSTDGGATFEFRAGLGPTPYHTTQPGGGDSDIAIDLDGTVYVTDQFGLFAESVQVSKDNGETWTGTGPASNAVPVDRQWLWPDPVTPGTVYLIYNNVGNGVAFQKTTDSGATWSQASIATPISTPPGPIVAIPTSDGSALALLAFTVFDGDRIVLVSSADGGATWSDQEVGSGHGAINDFFPQTFADAAGNLYVGWAEKSGEGASVVYVSSSDLGASWSPLKVVLTHPGLGTFLWGVAGEQGRIGFTWYESPDPTKEWYTHAAVVLDADTDAPRVTHARVSEDPVRTGEPCTSGSTCTSGRELGDFQQCAVAPTGELVVAYVTVLSAEEGGRITFAKTSSGPKLYESPPATWVV